MRRIIALLCLAVLGVVGFTATGGASTATKSDADHVTICHATGSASNPFVQKSPSASGVFNGHLGKSHQDGRDIIPPFSYKGQTYSQNWNASGQAIFNNGCKPVSTTTTTTPVTTTTKTPPTTTTVTTPTQTVTNPTQTATVTTPTVTTTKTVTVKSKPKVIVKTKVVVKKVVTKTVLPKPPTSAKHKPSAFPYTP